MKPSEFMPKFLVKCQSLTTALLGGYMFVYFPSIYVTAMSLYFIQITADYVVQWVANYLDREGASNILLASYCRDVSHKLW